MRDINNFYVCFVSIPYRQSQKSFLLDETIIPPIGFNSLQVESKDRRCQLSYLTPSHVSIPYRQSQKYYPCLLFRSLNLFQFLIGRVKRLPRSSRAVYTGEFQFLIGRVKRAKICSESCKHFKFQFLIGRVKRNRYRNRGRCFSKVSIPYRQSQKLPLSQHWR